MPKPNKTHATTANVDAFIEQLPKAEVRADCRALMQLMHEITGAEPYLYGPTIVGYGTYHYTYASGHQGDAPLAAFSPRKPELVLYFFPEALDPELLAKLGKHCAHLCEAARGHRPAGAEGLDPAVDLPDPEGVSAAIEAATPSPQGHANRHRPRRGHANRHRPRRVTPTATSGQ